MTTQASAALALAGCAVFLVLAFGVRTFIHLRRTGSTGFAGITGRPGSAEWCGGVLFAVAIAAGIAAPLVQLAGILSPYAALHHPTVQGLGAAFYLLGVAGTLWSQFAMGDSWRIGVDENDRTALVASGPFRWVRNPIFTAMTAATVGLALLVPNAISLVAVVALVVALEIQVRLVEEPYLLETHGKDYERYAAGTGRFVPGFGRFAAARRRI